MKKTIIALSGLMILALLTVTVVSAQTNDKKDKKAKTEVKHDCSKCPSAATCASNTSAANAEPVAASCDTTKCKAGKCDPAKCKEGKCDPAKCKEGKCDPATCKKECKGASSEATANAPKCCAKKAETK